jgi:hypothetical protein
MMRRMLVVAAALAALFSIAGCADERAPIDRVQPYALPKAFFIGEDFNSAADDPEFWTQGTLIDVGYGSSQDGLFTSTYAQAVSRIRFEITEDLLIARLAYERIDNSDGRGVGGSTQNGIIVAAYAIESHFDIVRQYNPTTGEQINVLEENSIDRPWNERQYIRVDWSKNLSTDTYDFDTLSLLGVYGNVTYEPLAYDVTTPDDPNAPVFDVDNGYFDVTNKAFVVPGMVDISFFGWGLGLVPTCWFDGDFMGGGFPYASCNPMELTIRQSFRRVVDRDFEPKDWDGYRFQAYGGFYVDRWGYARNYGMTDDNWHRLLSHHQIWERTHYYTDPARMTGAVECYTPTTTGYGQDPHRDTDRNGTEDECESVGGGSKCDTFRQQCTLPYGQRKTITIPWYMANLGDQNYYEPTAEAAHMWDVGLRAAVRSAQYAECTNTGGTPEDCLARFPVFFGQQDDFEDAIFLAGEVDKCRSGWAYPRQDCDDLAASLGSERNMDPGVISLAQMPEIVVLCHSPVEASDPAACSGPRLPAGTTADSCQLAYEARSADAQLLATCRAAFNVRRGDLRYNQVNAIKAPQSQSPWGIYADSVDPLTGMVIATSINIWTWVNDVWSQDAVDKMRFLAGEFSADDVTEGQYVHDWSLAAASAAANGGALPMMTRQAMADRLAQFAGAERASVTTPLDLPLPIRSQIQDINRAVQGVRASLDAPSSASAAYSARRLAARGTAFEAELMTPMVQQLEGIEGLPLDSGVMDMSSPLRGGNPAIRQQLARMKEEALARRGACVIHPEEADAPFSLIGLSRALQDKFGDFNSRDSVEVQQERAEHMRNYLKNRVHMSVISHEMGHSMGLRHNFAGSADAFEYRPQYWQLRTKNGAVTEPCTELAEDGESCVGPRWFDPVTAEERDNLIWMWSLGSIMDYPGEASQDLTGPAIYDFAAVRMLYGETVAVNTSPELVVGQPKAAAVLGKVDNFGGILGIRISYDNNDDGTAEDIHYSQEQNVFGLISDCQTVDPEMFRPADWNEDTKGVYSPLLDGMIVKVDNQWTRCKQPKVDYVPWTSQRFPSIAEAGQYYRGGPSIDRQGRTRVPYGFATDSWADLGNVSVYRHDNGADPYEIFNFFITSQEMWQIFETYRRNRSTFSVNSASGRILERYNAKVRDGAKGLGLLKNIYEDFALESGYQFDTLWPQVAVTMPENILGASYAFDHFARQLDRPEIGPHFYRPYDPNVLRSARDTVANPGGTQIIVPNGATGEYGAIGFGGKLVENMLSEDHGEYDSWYTLNAGSYYDKMWAAQLMTESVDNFISSTRNDFVDPRYRSVSVADLFPDGYRRWLGNNLTGDDQLKGPRVVADAEGNPVTDLLNYPTEPIGWVSWWTPNVEVCFPNALTNVCSAYGTPTSDPFHPRAPEYTAVLDPQVGWEQQKFVIAWTMLFLPENERSTWLDMMRVYELGTDPYPALEQRLEFHSPAGKVYVAKTFGREVIFGKTVQKGIAARVLEWANQLLALAYETDPGPDLDGDTLSDWPVLRYTVGTGLPIVKYDDTISPMDAEGNPLPAGVPGCNATENFACTCSSNRYCMALDRYLSVPAYLREAVFAYQLGEPGRRGVWD